MPIGQVLYFQITGIPFGGFREHLQYVCSSYSFCIRSRILAALHFPSSVSRRLESQLGRYSETLTPHISNCIMLSPYIFQWLPTGGMASAITIRSFDTINMTMDYSYLGITTRQRPFLGTSPLLLAFMLLHKWYRFT